MGHKAGSVNKTAKPAMKRKGKRAGRKRRLLKKGKPQVPLPGSRKSRSGGSAVRRTKRLKRLRKRSGRHRYRSGAPQTGSGRELPRTMLVLDHFVPHFDKDTGSRTMFQYLNLFAEMGLAVKFAGYDSTRYEPYTSILEERGIEVLNGDPEAMRQWLDRHGRTVAYAYINRPHVGELYLDMVRERTAAKIIYNSVDFGFLREERRALVEGNPLAQAHAEELRSREMALFHKSDAVFTVSEYERALLETLLPGKRVVDIPTFFYEPPFPLGQPVPFEERNLVTFVGGYNHSPNVDGVLWFASEIWPAVRARLPEAVLAVIGSNAPPSIMELHGRDGITVAGCVSDEELEWYYGRSKTVIAPLRYGAGVKGKVIEAVARGVPVVTTSVGAEGIRDWAEILIADDTPEGFAGQVTDLFLNPARWQWIRERQTAYACRYLTAEYAKQAISADIGMTSNKN